MTTKILSGTKNSKTEHYQLVTDIESIISQSKIRYISLILTYWQIGQRISGEKNYQNINLQNLADETKVKRTTLSRALLFFLNYKTLPQGNHLSWSHYRELLSIKDSGLRFVFEQKAEKEKLSRDALAKVIKQARTANLKTKEIRGVVRPTTPTYIYKAFVQRVIDGDTLLLTIDLGFEVLKEQRVRLAQINALEIGTEEGKKALVFLQERLADVEFVMVKTNKVDTFGRYIGDIFYQPTEKQKNSWESGGNLANQQNNETEGSAKPTKRMTKDQIFTEGNYLNEEIVKAGLAEIY